MARCRLLPPLDSYYRRHRPYLWPFVARAVSRQDSQLGWAGWRYVLVALWERYSLLRVCETCKCFLLSLAELLTCSQNDGFTLWYGSNNEDMQQRAFQVAQHAYEMTGKKPFFASSLTSRNQLPAIACPQPSVALPTTSTSTTSSSLTTTSSGIAPTTTR
jgi:hypothetical protein